MGSLVVPLAACSVSDDAVFSSASDISSQARVDLSTTDAGEAASTADAGSDESTGTVEIAEAAAAETVEIAEAEMPAEEAPAPIETAEGDAVPETETVAAAAPEADAAAGEPAQAALAVVAEDRPGPTPFARLFSRQNGTAADEQAANEQMADEQGASDASPAALAETVDGDEADLEELAEADDIEMEEEDVVSHVTTASITASAASPAASGQRESILLPGVRESSSLYQFATRDNFDYNSYDNEGGTIQVASAVGMAALAGRRLQVQHARVDVTCLKPQLVNKLRRIESHFGRPVVVTSGFRDRQHNRRVGGARASKHMSCEAADIQVPGVTKWQIAEFVRSLPGRGGVGTYCHTESVHVDIGSKRDWNWRCRRRS